SCRTLARRDFIRVPRPAARIRISAMKNPSPGPALPLRRSHRSRRDTGGFIFLLDGIKRETQVPARTPFDYRRLAVQDRVTRYKAVRGLSFGKRPAATERVLKDRDERRHVR